MLNTTNSNSEYLHNYIRRVAKQEQESVDTSNVYTGTIEATQSGIYTVTLNQSDNSSSVLAIPIVTGDMYDKNEKAIVAFTDNTYELCRDDTYRYTAAYAANFVAGRAMDGVYRCFVYSYQRILCNRAYS